MIMVLPMTNDHEKRYCNAHDGPNRDGLRICHGNVQEKNSQLFNN
jgi:hypothetical protein